MEKTALIVGGIAVVGILAYLAYKKTLTATTAGQLKISPSGVSGNINLQPIETGLVSLVGAAFNHPQSVSQNNNPSSGTAYSGAPLTYDNSDGFYGNDPSDNSGTGSVGGDDGDNSDV